MRRWYRKVVRSFFIWMLLSSIWATVKMRILHFLQTYRASSTDVNTSCGALTITSFWQKRRVQACTLCWRRRKGSSISMPPSWTIHHTSMWPSVKRSPLDGKAETFLGTSRALLAAVVSLTSSVMKTRLYLLSLMNTAYHFWRIMWHWRHCNDAENSASHHRNILLCTIYSNIKLIF